MSNITKATSERRSAALLGIALGAALLLAAGSACGSEPTATVAPTATPASIESPTAAPADTVAAPVGTDAGDSLPHFEMTLVDGSTVSTELLAAQGQPAFLYFFSTW